MEYYSEIRLIPDPDFPSHLLFNALFNKLHRALVAGQYQTIGVSFPGYKEGRCRHGLGDTLRLHSDQAPLKQLMGSNWLQGMHDHIVIEDCLPVPAIKGYRIIKRQQFKTNAERLRRRRMVRHGETLEEARLHIPDSIERRVSLPYLQLTSHSTRQQFCLFIALGNLQQAPSAGSFNSYGLSTTASVPWF